MSRCARLIDDGELVEAQRAHALALEDLDRALDRDFESWRAALGLRLDELRDLDPTLPFAVAEVLARDRDEVDGIVLKASPPNVDDKPLDRIKSFLVAFHTG